MKSSAVNGEGGQVNGRFLGPTIAAALLMAVGGSLAGCGNMDDSEDVTTVTGALLTYDATKVGCPNSGYVAIKSVNNYHCRPDTNSWMTCYSTTLTQEGYFRVVDNGDGTIAIRARDGANLTWQNYLAATNGGGSGIYHNGINPTDYNTKFISVPDGAGHYSFRTNYNGYYVTAENGGGNVMNANRTQIGSWEKFTVECF